MSKCECCDHPLARAIQEVIDRYETSGPTVGKYGIIKQLREALENWRADTHEPTDQELREEQEDIRRDERNARVD